MDLLKFDAEWFCSERGQKAFSSLDSLEDRSIFLYSYLKRIAKGDFEKDQILFRIAFFLADGVLGSALPYSAYPALVDPEKNPFVAYLKNADHCPVRQVVYYIFLSILHNIAAPIKRNEWVYEKKIEDLEYLEQTLTKLGKCFCDSDVGMASADAFTIEESLQPVQLKLIWLLGQQ